MNIESTNEIKNINIYNIFGQKKHSQEWTSGQKEIDVKHLQSGLYFVKANFSNNQTKTFKIIMR